MNRPTITIEQLKQINKKFYRNREVLIDIDITPDILDLLDNAHALIKLKLSNYNLDYQKYIILKKNINISELREKLIEHLGEINITNTFINNEIFNVNILFLNDYDELLLEIDGEVNNVNISYDFFVREGEESVESNIINDTRENSENNIQNFTLDENIHNLNDLMYLILSRIVNNLSEENLSELEGLINQNNNSINSHLSEEELNNIKEEKYNKDLFETKMCSICYKDYITDENLKILNCNHYFHSDCISKWLLSYNSKCPLCNKNQIV